MEVEDSSLVAGLPEIGYDLVCKIVPATTGIVVVALLYLDRQHFASLQSQVRELRGVVLTAGAAVALACLYGIGTSLHVFGGATLYLIRVALVKSVPNYRELVHLLDPLVVAAGGSAQHSPKSAPRRAGWLRKVTRVALVPLVLWHRLWRWANDEEKLYMRGYFAMKIVSTNARAILPKYAAEAAFCANLSVLFATLTLFQFRVLPPVNLQVLGMPSQALCPMALAVSIVGTVLLSVRNFDIQIAFLECARRDLKAMADNT